jgi:predicted GIY-YIG superfamily endonuclease
MESQALEVIPDVPGPALGPDPLSTQWLCYLIKAERGFTYVGITNRIQHRLRQHNGEIKGGAKATRGKGPWSLVCCITGFPSKQALMQFEWRMHHPSGSRRRTGTRSSGRVGGIVWRIECLQRILALEHWTSSAPATSGMQLCVHWFAPPSQAVALPGNVTQRVHQ